MTYTPKILDGCDAGTVYRQRAYLNSHTGILETVIVRETCKWCSGEGCVGGRAPYIETGKDDAED